MFLHHEHSRFYQQIGSICNPTRPCPKTVLPVPYPSLLVFSSSSSFALLVSMLLILGGRRSLSANPTDTAGYRSVGLGALSEKVNTMEKDRRWLGKQRPGSVERALVFPLFCSRILHIRVTIPATRASRATLPQQHIYLRYVEANTRVVQ